MRKPDARRPVGAQGCRGPARKKQEIAWRELEVLPGRAGVELSMLEEENLLGIQPGGARERSPPPMRTAPISTQRAPTVSPSMRGHRRRGSVAGCVSTRIRRTRSRDRLR